MNIFNTLSTLDCTVTVSGLPLSFILWRQRFEFLRLWDARALKIWRPPPLLYEPFQPTVCCQFGGNLWTVLKIVSQSQATEFANYLFVDSQFADYLYPTILHPNPMFHSMVPIISLLQPTVHYSILIAELSQTSCELVVSDLWPGLRPG